MNTTATTNPGENMTTLDAARPCMKLIASWIAADAAKAAAPVALRFFYNGIKVDKGALQKCHYSLTEEWSPCAGKTIPTQIAIYGKHYKDFSAEIHAEFTVTNDSDSQTDYFSNDRIVVLPTHPRFADVAAALIADLNRRAVRCDGRGRALDAAGYRREIAKVNAILAGRAN